MTKVTQKGTGGNPVAEKHVDFAYYDAASRLTTITRYNNLSGSQQVAVSTFTHDNLDRLTGPTHAKGQTTFADCDWTSGGYQTEGISDGRIPWSGLAVDDPNGWGLTMEGHQDRQRTIPAVAGVFT